MLKSPVVWIAAIWVGVMIHLDWHLGRPPTGLSYHWLLAILAFMPLTWVAGRRWPEAPSRAATWMILLGLLLGQGIVPVGEVLLYDEGWDPFTNPLRWSIFTQFLSAGFLTHLISQLLFGRWLGRGMATSSKT
ncbi:MAG TPA: hypothetical protein VGA78_08265 [Gemmatimonadales bacterium]|jgi:hypothetical protein